MRVLVVDNNVELCKALEDYFDRQPDLEVVGMAHDGEGAVDLIQSLEPDVVLLDITMPYLDGLGVMERLHTLNLKKKPKVVVITAFGTDNLLSRLMALGADYFMIKPFQLEILAQRLREFAATSKEVVALEGAAALDTRTSADQTVLRLLHDMGVPPHYKGFSYLKDAVLMYSDEGYFVGGLPRGFIPPLARSSAAQPGGVRQAFGNRLGAAWRHANLGSSGGWAN